MTTQNELVGEKIVCYCRKKTAERVVPYTGGQRALEIIIEGRGMTSARCIVLKPWRLAQRQLKAFSKNPTLTCKVSIVMITGASFPGGGAAYRDWPVLDRSRRDRQKRRNPTRRTCES